MPIRGMTIHPMTLKLSYRLLISTCDAYNTMRVFYYLLVSDVIINVISCVHVTLYAFSHSITSHLQKSRQYSHPHSKTLESFNIYNFIVTRIVMSALVRANFVCKIVETRVFT